MLHKAWNSKGKVPYCFPRSSIKFQGHTGQNITDFDPNWAFPDYRPVAAFKSLRFALFMITKQRAKISSLNFLCLCIIRLWLQLYEYMSLMTSPGHKIGQILKLIYLRQYLNYSVDQKLKMSEMLMAIFLVYSPSGITSRKKVCCELKMAAILKILKYHWLYSCDMHFLRHWWCTVRSKLSFVYFCIWGVRQN